jgi:uracil-DNA glycosylase
MLGIVLIIRLNPRPARRQRRWYSEQMEPGVQPRANLLATLQAEIRGCRRCQERGLLEEARPVRYDGQVTSPIMLIGQAPGPRTERYGRHFGGPAGGVLERWFERAGFRPGYLRERVYFSALTRCFPGKAAGGKGDRVPSAAEQALCRPFLDRELELIRPPLVLLVGTLAVRTMLGPLSLNDAVGSAFERDGRQIIPLPHPSGVSRWLNEPANRARVDLAINRLGKARMELRLE